jgi:hypothetical protein
MPNTFLFRFDGAQENDAFLEQARSKGHLVYAGLAMQLDRGWIPDFIEVSLDEESHTYSVTIIELESTVNVALISARKYLPESSQEILTTFREYLRRVLQRCRSTADPRGDDIQELNDALTGHLPITIWTAGALRQPPTTIENLPLIDQGHTSNNVRLNEQIDAKANAFQGERSLSSRDHKSLARSILILDAVVRGWDNSDASLRVWRGLRSQPLRNQIQQHSQSYPALLTLLLGRKDGARMIIDDVVRELAVIWSDLQKPGKYSETAVLAAIKNFLPIDRTLDPHAPVRMAFEKARLILSNNAD